MKWIQELYEQTHDLWQQTGKDSSGYSIFYSPVVSNPKLLIIGYNPGGDKSSFNENNTEPPKQHDYIVGNYRMAQRMKFIFESAGILPELNASVKMNLIYFRSKNIKSLKHSTETIEYCYIQSKMVIDELRPDLIVVEGFSTFTELSRLLKIEEHNRTHFRGKCILLHSCYINSKVIAIPHPTGARGITNEHWRKIGESIREATCIS